MPYELLFNVDIPGFAPTGEYGLTAYVKGDVGKSTSETIIACLDVAFSL